MNVDWTNVDETEIIKLSQRGDSNAFNVLVKRYRPEALNIAYRMLGNRNDAEDACQIAWISVWKAIKKFRGGNFRAWELAILSNCCRYEYHKRIKRPELPTNDFAPILVSISESERLIDKEKRSAVQAAILKLSPEQRFAIILNSFSGLRYEEIAHVMHCSIGTVKSRIHRAIINLRDILKDEELLK